MPLNPLVYGVFKPGTNRSGRISLYVMFLIDSSHDLASAKLELITEKIAQPSTPPRVSRARLLSMLEKSMATGTATIISGRAGTGKTALAVDFAHKCGRPVAWYK